MATAAAVDIALLHLPVLALVFSMAEFGMTVFNLGQADITMRGGLDRSQYLPHNNWVYIHAPWQYVFLVFASSWTMVISIILLVTQFLIARKTMSHSKIVSVVTLSFNALTTVVWLVGFAGIIDLYGTSVAGLYATVVAFAILPWLAFLFLTILNVCTAFGVVESTRFGYGPLRNSHVRLDDDDERTHAASPSSPGSGRSGPTS